MLTADSIKAKSADIGFDLCGVAPATSVPEMGFLREWIARGFAGEMAYMARTADRRADVRNVLPTARSVIALATLYNVDRPYSTELGSADVARLARYAWGDDYHLVIDRRMGELLVWMRDASDSAFDARAYVDTGPVQERAFAQRAGIGWVGKHTCVNNPNLGSWLFLSVIITSLVLEPDEPALDQCGTCTLCLDACPTGAIVEPWVVDATRCLSYLTIEVRGDMPLAERDEVGAHVFGCDICQDVCPWNASSACSDDASWLPRDGFDRPTIVELWRRPDTELSGLLRRSSMKRTGLTRLRRNLAVALGNTATETSRRALEPDSLDSTVAPSLDDPMVASHVEWARWKLDRH